MLLIPPVLALLLVFAFMAWGQTDSPSSAQQVAKSGVSTQRFEDSFRAHQREHELMEKSLVEARKVIDMRLEEMNDLRKQLELERGTFQTRTMSDRTRESIEDRLNKLEQAIAAADGRAKTWAVAVGLFFGLMQFVGFKLMPEKRVHDERRPR